MSYAVKYIFEFDDVNRPGASTVVYKCEILQSFYDGPITRIPVGGKPVIHSWETDEATPSIKGSSLKVNYINEGWLPLKSFYSTSDQDYQCIFYKGGQVLFIGFLVQDDCSEMMVDYGHEVQLSFTDNLGLLKDFKLDEKSYVVPLIYERASVSLIAPTTLRLSNTNLNHPASGILLRITGATPSAVNGTYGTVGFVNTGIYTDITVSGIVSNAPQEEDRLIFEFSPIEFVGRVNLMAIMIVCLKNTGLELEIMVGTSIFENRQHDLNTFLYQTYVDISMFSNGDEFKNCYDVIDIICKSYGLTVMQSQGRWYIFRFQELRYLSFAPSSFNYYLLDQFGILIGYINEFISDFIIEIGPDKQTIPYTGLTSSIIRPYQYSKKTFEYNVPSDLLQNCKLDQLGTLLRTYTSGSGVNIQTTREYTFVHWYPGNLSLPEPTYYIRVISDYLNNEIDRYLVIAGFADSQKAIVSEPIEMNVDDVYQLTFSYRTSSSQGGNINYILKHMLVYTVANARVHAPNVGQWLFISGYTINIPSGDNSNQWHSVTITPPPIPFDGKLYIHFGQMDFGPYETQIKDIRFNAVPFINASTKIIGQTHTTTQDNVIKNNSDIDISIDDTPRNIIAGTTFLASFNGLLQQRTVSWYRSLGIGIPSTESRKIGDITTKENLFWHRIPRTKLEGEFKGIYQNRSICAASVVFPSLFPNKIFVWGRLEIDYRDNSCNGTLYEISNISEPDSELESTYDFQYLYDTK